MWELLQLLACPAARGGLGWGVSAAGIMIQCIINTHNTCNNTDLLHNTNSHTGHILLFSLWTLNRKLSICTFQLFKQQMKKKEVCCSAVLQVVRVELNTATVMDDRRNEATFVVLQPVRNCLGSRHKYRLRAWQQHNLSVKPSPGRIGYIVNTWLMLRLDDLKGVIIFFPTTTAVFHPSTETRDVSVRSFSTIDLFNLLFIAPTNFSGYKTNKWIENKKEFNRNEIQTSAAFVLLVVSVLFAFRQNCAKINSESD